MQSGVEVPDAWAHGYMAGQCNQAFLGFSGLNIYNAFERIWFIHVVGLTHSEYYLKVFKLEFLHKTGKIFLAFLHKIGRIG